MFVLVTRVDSIPITPEKFGDDLDTVLRDLIERKYSNKVLAGEGLCICLYEILNIGAGHFVPDSGSAYTEVQFRLVMFRPFVGEALVGRIASQTMDSVIVSLGFFADIKVPASLLQQPSQWNEETGEWEWQFEGQKLPMFKDHEIMFKVHKIQYATIKENSKRRVATITETPEHAGGGATGSPMLLSRSRQRSRSLSMDVFDDPGLVLPALTIIGTMNETGLGMLQWWEEGEDGEEEEEIEEA